MTRIVIPLQRFY
jgi:hypothetical protein